jgi:tetratricopeptide (TPR) repeat protein
MLSSLAVSADMAYNSGMGRKESKRATNQGKEERTHRKLRIVTAGMVLGITALFLIIGAVRFLSYGRAIRGLPSMPKISDKNPTLQEALAEADRKSRAWPPRGGRVGALAMIYHANFFYPQAKACYRAAMKLQPKNPRWPYYLADIDEKMGENRETVSLIETTIRLEPGYDPARLKLANAYFKADRQDDAEALFQSLLGRAETSPYALLGLGRIAVSRRDWAKAADYLERTIAAVPRFGAAFRLLATVYSRLGRPDSAAIARDRASSELFYELPDPWIEALDSDCYDVAGLVRRITDTLKHQRLNRAFELSEKALFIVPDNAENTMSVALALFDSQGRSMSLPLFQKVVRLQPSNEDAYLHMAAIFVETNKYEETEKIFRRILEINPRSIWAWVGLGDIRFRKGEIDSAAEFYRKARESDPRSARVLYALGTVEYEKKNLKQAIRYLEESLRLDERYVSAHLTLGTILSEMDDLEGAAAHFRRIIEINPFLAMGRYNLGNVHYRRGQFADAIYHYNRTLEIDPTFGDALLNLGAALEKTGKRTEARDRFRRALDLARKTGNRDLENKVLDNLKIIGERD